MFSPLSPGSLSGVFVPFATPFHADGSLALEAVAPLIEYLLDSGVTGLVVAGTTGEGYALTACERHELLSEAIHVSAGRVPVLCGVGGTNTADAVAQATTARQCGAHGMMVAAPAYCLPTPEELAQHVLAVVTAGELPTVLYDYPARTGVQFDAATLDVLAPHPLVIGIKEASGDLDRLPMLATYAGDLAVVSGSDTLAMHYLAAGATSWIAGFGNVLPAEHVAMVSAAVAGDLAAGWAVQERLSPILTNVESGRYNAKVKAGLQLRGFAVGPTRPPIAPLEGAELAELRDQLAALGHGS
jgi:4-hydroxy-tetrahydrodipicolinate synthase